MLRTRVITALALLLLLLPALFYLPQALWLALVLAGVLTAAWEWARLVRYAGRVMWLFVAATGVACGLILFVFPALARAGYGLAFLFWLLAVPAMFITAARPSGWAAALTGWCVLLPFAASLADLRELGPWLLISIMALAWVADTAAYFAGRAFGRRKLAPSISPGKTWEGVAGAVAATGLYAAANLYWDNPLLTGVPWWAAMLTVGVLLTATGIVGDLFESAMKRSAGLKDSSHLLPGHGGVLDRIDSLTSTLPVAALLLIWSGKL